MLLKIALILISISALILIPHRWWQSFYTCFKQVADWSKEKRGKSTLERGQTLQRELARLRGGVLLQTAGGPTSFSEYKFFTSLCHQLLDVHRRMGAPLRSPMTSLATTLAMDLKFEKRLQEIVRGTLAQFGLISIVVWSFTFMTTWTLEFGREFSIDLIMCLLQASGLWFFLSMAKLSHRIHLQWFDNVMKSSSVFGALLDTGLSNSEIVSRSELLKVLPLLQKSPEFVRRIEDLLARWKNCGGPIAHEWAMVHEEIGELGETSFSHHVKSVTALKFATTAIFFLGSYFVYLSHLFGRFLIE